MRPLSRKTVKFPNKNDCHPEKGYQNWWEDIAEKGKGKQKQELLQEIKNEVQEIENLIKI